MNDLYTILINEDHSFTHTNRKRIMHRSNMIDSIRFLVKPVYNGCELPLDMTKVNVLLQYVTPISRTYKVITLKPETDLYKNRVQYIVPIDINMTKEVGDLEMTINFSYLAMTANGKFIEQVRPIGCTAITIEPTTNWSDYIPTADLDNLAQMAMMNQATAEQNRINIEMMSDMMATSLKHNTEDNTLYLVNEDGIKVGDAIPTDDLGNCDCEDGVPVIELIAIEPEDPDGLVDNVVEI